MLATFGAAILALMFGAVLGYFARLNIARGQIGSAEARIAELKIKHDQEVQEAKLTAKKEAQIVIDGAQKEASEIRKSVMLLEKNAIKKEEDIEKRQASVEIHRDELRQKAEKIKTLYADVETMRHQETDNIAKIAQMSQDQAQESLLKKIEVEREGDLVERINKLEHSQKEHLENKAKNIMVLAMQKYAQAQASEFNTSSVSITNEEVKGKIIGKEGRNIKTLENLTGVQVIIDDAPDSIVLSCFDPVRRQIAKIALESLIEDGRIQPARIEEFVIKARESINQKIKEAGEAALYDTGLTGIDPKLTYILGRLRFRTSFGQNVLVHSIEVAHIAGAIAAEIGANVKIAKMGGLFHDVGKAVDHEIEGTHVEIGRTLLKKYGVTEDVIKAMQSHHEEYPYETLESRIVQAADALSASRPGARRDSVENYVKRLTELEALANNFSGIDRTYAINAGREIRVFVVPHQINDFQAKGMARDIASRIEEELRYPGEIKVTLIRETRIIDYAR